MSNADRCTRAPECEFDADHWPDTPCGQPAEPPGTPCRYCSDPVPLDGSACPTCWTPATIPLMKAVFAPYGLSVDVVDER